MPAKSKAAKPRSLITRFIAAMGSDAAHRARGGVELRTVLAERLGPDDTAELLGMTLLDALGAVTVGELLQLIDDEVGP